MDFKIISGQIKKITIKYLNKFTIKNNIYTKKLKINTNYF